MVVVKVAHKGIVKKQPVSKVHNVHEKYWSNDFAYCTKI